jgi:hypothetical protein
MPRKKIEEKKKNLNVYVELSKLQTVGARETAKEARKFAIFLNDRPENLQKWTVFLNSNFK